MEAFLAEKLNFKLAFAPVNGTAAQQGARIAVNKGNRIAVLLQFGAGTGSTVQVTLNQHNAASGGTSKVLATDNSYYVKAGAATSFTKVEPSSKLSMFDISAQFAADGGIAIFEVLQEDLDVNNNFSHLSVDLAGTATAKIVSGTYVVNQASQLPGYAQSL